MRPVIACLTALVASPAAAHPGHFAELAGHSHWIALGALAAAGLLTAVLAGKKRKDADANADEGAEDDAEEVEA